MPQTPNAFWVDYNAVIHALNEIFGFLNSLKSYQTSEKSGTYGSYLMKYIKYQKL